MADFTGVPVLFATDSTDFHCWFYGSKITKSWQFANFW